MMFTAHRWEVTRGKLLAVKQQRRPVGRPRAKSILNLGDAET
jgi:hypothetical protein